MQLIELKGSIRDVLPHIFRRPVLSVSPSDSLLQAGTFLAIGPQIYVDGLVVLEGKKPVGRIGGQHLIKFMLENQEAWLHSNSSQIMNPNSFEVDMSDSISKALEIFGNTKFAFVPIVDEGIVTTSLSIRDMLRLAAGKVCNPIEDLSSKLVSINSGTTIEKALQLMIEKGIRNLAVRNDHGQIHIINDRKILEFLLSYEGRRLMASRLGLDSVSVELLEMVYPKYVKASLPGGSAAELLSDVSTPCLLWDDHIVTPWDIVMKGIYNE